MASDSEAEWGVLEGLAERGSGVQPPAAMDVSPSSAVLELPGSSSGVQQPAARAIDVPGSANSGIEEPAEPGSGVQPLSAKWQAMYDGSGVPYWWDYPEEVSTALESNPTQSLNWVWAWPQRYGDQNQKFNRYLLFPVDKIQYNLDTESKRQMRRIMVLQ